MAATTDRATVIQRLREIFDSVTDGRCDVAKVEEDAHIMQDLGLTSLELLELRFELESVWNISLSDEQAQRLRTVGDVVNLIVGPGA